MRPESPEKRVKKLGLRVPKLMKASVEKMSVFRLSTILMKTNKLYPSFHDVDENKGESRCTRG
jgi:hypothetical protein